MSKNRVTGKINTAVSIRYLSEQMDKGRYTTQPSGSVAADADTQVFVAEPLENALDGAVGSNKWMAADGTIFEFKFDNFHYNNQASSNMSDVGGPWLLPAPDYPTQGWDWTVTYKIGHTSAFCDAPVFPDDLLAEPRCETFGDEVVRRWIGERAAVALADVLQHRSLPTEAKLWCAAHPLFLTARSKRLLLAELAKNVAADGGGLAALRDQAADLNDAAAAGDAPPSAFEAMADSIAAMRAERRDDAAFAILSAMAAENADIAWSNAVYAKVGSPDDADREEAARSILALIEARL